MDTRKQIDKPSTEIARTRAAIAAKRIFALREEMRKHGRGITREDFLGTRGRGRK